MKRCEFEGNSAQVPTEIGQHAEDSQGCKTNLSNLLADDVARLSLSFDGVTLTTCDSIDENTAETPLLMTVTKDKDEKSRIPDPRPQYTSITDTLRRFGVAFTLKDVNYILKHDFIRLDILMSPNLTQDVAQAVPRSAKSRIKTSTMKAIARDHELYLDGSLDIQHGQDKSAFYYACTKSGGVRVAKVYNGHKDVFLREVNVSETMDHPNLVKFIKSFSIQNDSRHIIIMPFYPKSVEDMVSSIPYVPLGAIGTIARSCFDALCHLHAKGYCFGDLKPSNIMLATGLQGHAVLVDYGGVVPLGSFLEEYTERYCLDVEALANEHLDWICLGSTLAELGGINLFSIHGFYDLVDEVDGNIQNEHLKALILSCVENPSPSKIELALSQFETSIVQSSSLPLETHHD